VVAWLDDPWLVATEPAAPAARDAVTEAADAAALGGAWEEWVCDDAAAAAPGGRPHAAAAAHEAHEAPCACRACRAPPRAVRVDVCSGRCTLLAVHGADVAVASPRRACASSDGAAARLAGSVRVATPSMDPGAAVRGRVLRVTGARTLVVRDDASEDQEGCEAVGDAETSAATTSAHSLSRSVVAEASATMTSAHSLPRSVGAEALARAARGAAVATVEVPDTAEVAAGDVIVLTDVESLGRADALGVLSLRAAGVAAARRGPCGAPPRRAPPLEGRVDASSGCAWLLDVLSAPPADAFWLCVRAPELLSVCLPCDPRAPARVTARLDDGSATATATAHGAVAEALLGLSRARVAFWRRASTRSAADGGPRAAWLLEAPALLAVAAPSAATARAEAPVEEAAAVLARLRVERATPAHLALELRLWRVHGVRVGERGGAPAWAWDASVVGDWAVLDLQGQGVEEPSGGADGADDRVLVLVRALPPAAGRPALRSVGVPLARGLPLDRAWLPVAPACELAVVAAQRWA
jgi:hypothetical protein